MRNTKRRAGLVSGVSLLMLGLMSAGFSAAGAAAEAGNCPQCAQWNKARKPFRIYGNTFFVGTEGLTAILVTSDFGHALIGAGLPESAPLIKANIEALGFRLADVKAILPVHARADNAGGVAELQWASDADVYALWPAESVLRTGKPAADDPYYADKSAGVPKVSRVWIVQDEQLLGLGSVRMRVLATPGNSPGGASWSWESCEGGNCLNFLYADTLVPSAPDSYRMKDHPQVTQALESSIHRIEAAACDVLVTPRPEDTQLFQRLDPEGGTRAASIKDSTACAAYAKSAREALARRLAAGK